MKARLPAPSRGQRHPCMWLLRFCLDGVEGTGETDCGITLHNCRVPPFHRYPAYSFETSYYSWEIMTLKAYLYEEGNSLLRRFCFAKDLCILPVSSEFLTTSIHLMEQILNQCERYSPVDQKLEGWDMLREGQWWWERLVLQCYGVLKKGGTTAFQMTRLVKERTV